MSNRAGERVAVNWRGLFLAAAIFSGVFALLLAMAHQSQSKASDVGSSVRQDPYGASLLFDAYARAGYQVKRSPEEESLADENAAATTAFFIGGRDWGMGESGAEQAENLRGRVEEFLARGGRVVLVAPAWNLKSESQGWQVGREWDETPTELRPIWVSPVAGAMPAGSEPIFLAGDAPWLKPDPAWTVLYAGTDSPAHPYVAKRIVKNGELIAASQESFLWNEVIKTNANPVLLDYLAGGRPNIWVDEALHGMSQRQGVLWLVQRYRLEPALLLFWATLLVLLWSMSGDLVRRPARDRGAPVVRSAESAGVASRRLLQRSVATEQVVAAVWEEFRRRAPHDAQAIADDVQSGPLLRKALLETPLAGYRQLSRLIAARRAAARGLARQRRNAAESSTSSAKKNPEEVRLV